jgi:hypothetical protein
MSCLLVMAAVAVDAADKPVKKVAPTVAEALKVFDPAAIKRLPVKDDQEVGRLNVGGFSYNTTETVEKAFDFHKQQLLKAKWKEGPHSQAGDGYATATFAKDGYQLTLNANAIGDSTLVSFSNHSKLDLKKLPVPKGVKPFYGFATVEAYLSDSKDRDAVAAEVTKLLVAQGWEPYGTAGDQLFFRQNAVRLSANVMSAPAQENKVAITYSTEQLSAEIPAPAETVQLQYSDSTKQLFFDYAADDIDAGFAEVHKFFNDKLGAAGWKPTTDELLEDKGKKFVVYRNPAKDMLDVEMTEFEGNVRVYAKFQTAKEVEEIEAEIDAQIAAKKKKDAEQKSKPKAGAVKIALPANAKNVKSDKSEIKFNVGNGKAKPFAEALLKKLKADDWEALSTTLDAMAGVILLKKGDQDLTIMYLETGVLPSEVTITGEGLEVEKAKK